MQFRGLRHSVTSASSAAFSPNGKNPPTSFGIFVRQRRSRITRLLSARYVDIH